METAELVDSMLYWYQEIVQSYGKPDQAEAWGKVKNIVDPGDTVPMEKFELICETMAVVSDFWGTGIPELDAQEQKIPLVDLGMVA